jgi:hypothetical protein
LEDTKTNGYNPVSYKPEHAYAAWMHSQIAFASLGKTRDDIPIKRRFLNTNTMWKNYSAISENTVALRASIP